MKNLHIFAGPYNRLNKILEEFIFTQSNTISKAMKYILFALLLSTTVATQATGNAKEAYRGQVLDATTGDPIEYVSIGIEKRNIGTVSTDEGLFAIILDPKYDNDTIRFSSIGYANYRTTVNQLRRHIGQSISLTPTDIQLKEIVVDPVKLKSRTLGNEYSGTKINAGFSSNRKGYEVGVLLDIKNPTFLQQVTFNLVKCSYSKLFYRLNIYRQTEEGQFENILQEPIYINQRIDETTPNISVSLSQHNIIVDQNTLITLEHVKDMGEGWLTFSANQNLSKGATCYYRTTSHGEWEKSPYKFGFSVQVKEEKR